MSGHRPPVRLALEAQEVVKRFPSGDGEITVLDGVFLGVAAGEFVSVMGPSGSGKSTLLNLIGLLDRPTAGSIRLFGDEMGTVSRNAAARARRVHLGFVFQSFHLLPRVSALANVMLPMALAGVPRKERRSRAEALLGRVGLGDRLEYRPTKLSGGQKQRVAIARALALDPPILLADEPTGNLDSKTSQEIMALFAELHRQGKTIVQVTHDENMARFGDRIIRFKDGRIRRVDTRPTPRGPVAPVQLYRAAPAASGVGA